MKVYLHTDTQTFSKNFQQHTDVKNNLTVDKISKKQKETIAILARKGCTLSETGTALGFSQSQLTQILEEESHPFNVTYWNAKVAYTQRLRDFVMDIAENGVDEAVRAKIVEYLVTENSKAFENKRLHTGYTNIRKLLSLVRQQFTDKRGTPNFGKVIQPDRKRLRDAGKEAPRE
jgi:predicted transcriptional regulator